LLGEAGWRDRDGDGLRDRDGKAFQFTAVVWPGWGLENAAVYIQAQLRQVGVQMDIRTLEGSAMSGRFLAGEFEAAIYRIILGNLRLGPLGIFGASSPIGYSHPKVLALLEKAWATMDPEEHERDYRDIEPIFQADLPLTFLYPHVSTTVASRRIRGLSSPYWIDPIWHANQLWLEDER
jgi:peptide/nickel transport system substrate-binding protein